MCKKISFFLILLFALNVVSASFQYSAIFAKDKINFGKQKEETKSAFRKAIELVAKPFAYVFHKIYFTFLGPPELGIAYNIQIDKVYKPTSKPNVYKDDPGSEVRNVQVFIPIILLNAETEVITAKNFVATVSMKTKSFLNEMKKTPIGYYKVHYEKYKNINIKNVSTKYGNMIELNYSGEIDPFFHIELAVGASPRKIHRVFPYYLSSEYSLACEERLSDAEEEEHFKTLQGRIRKIATYIYVSWKGKGQLKLDFWIGAGAHFGYAGSNGLGYSFCKEQLEKTVKFEEIKKPNYLKRYLIFSKPGWYKICMEKEDYISAL